MSPILSLQEDPMTREVTQRQLSEMLLTMCVFTFACKHIYACKHAFVYICRPDQRSILNIDVLQDAFCLIFVYLFGVAFCFCFWFFKTGFLWIWSSPVRLGLLARAASCPHLPGSRIAGVCHTASFCMRVLEVKLRSSCLCGKCSTDGAISPDSCLLLRYPQIKADCAKW